MSKVSLLECGVYGCKNNSLTVDNPAIQYYLIPRAPEIAQQWITAIIWKNEDIDLTTARVCSIHFDNDCYTNEYKKTDNLNYIKVLKCDAVPNVNLPFETIIKTNINETEATTSELNNLIVLNLPDSEHFATYDAIVEYSNVPQISEAVPIAVKEDINAIIHKNVDVYNNTNTISDYLNLQKENDLVQKNITQLEQRIQHLKDVCSKKEANLQNLSKEIELTKKRHSALFYKTLTTTQKKKILAKVFSESQMKILSGKKKIYWSNDDLAVGYTIRHMSNKRCYMYLMKTLNFPLPALSSLKRWAKSSNKKPVPETSEKNEENKSNEESD